MPLLVAFLGLGMLLGSEGPGGVPFDDADLAREVGVIGLAAILFEGGLSTAWRGLRPVLLPAALLGTVGVIVTGAVTGVGAYYLFDLDPAAAFLLGAVVGSTDAAAVFATLRFTAVRRRIAHLLEAESGGNDPMAVALTIGLIEWLRDPSFRLADIALLLVRELGLGLAIGIVLGMAASAVFARLSPTLAPFVPVASVATAALAFAIPDVLGGSGFLAVYVVGLWVGNTRTPFRRSVVAFHAGLAFLAQVVLFVVLGLLVFPSRLLPVILPGLALAAVLVFVARPLAVWVSTLGQGFTVRERVLVGWAGLRGAIPIVLATFPLSEQVEASETIFNAVFFVVLVSALLQGPTLAPLTRRLGLVSRAGPVHAPPLDVGAIEALGAELLEYEVEPIDSVVGTAVRDLRLPRDALIAVVLRGDQAVPPRGSTVIQPGDRLYVLARARSRRAVERLFEQWEGAG